VDSVGARPCRNVWILLFFVADELFECQLLWSLRFFCEFLFY
jgi:hypothetical protein